MIELLQDYLIRSAKRFPKKAALLHRNVEMSYETLLGHASAIAGWLRVARLPTRFRGGILTDDPAEYVAAYFGILGAGGIVVGLNSQTTARSFLSVSEDCALSVLFISGKLYAQVSPVLCSMSCLRHVVVSGPGTAVSDVGGIHTEGLETVWNRPGLQDMDLSKSCSGEDVAQIIYTSGTTGRPKGVMLRHSGLIANTESIIAYLGLSEEDRVMAVLPFFYSYGNSVLLTHLAVGGTLVVNQSFLYPNVILDEMVRHQVTGFSGVPSTFSILLHRSALRDYSFPHLRYLTLAGGAMPSRHIREVVALFPYARLFVMYGQTEASARLSYLAPEQLEKKVGSIGKAISGVTLKLLDPEGRPVPTGEVGEIVAEGANLMAGYWGKPEDTRDVLRPEGLWTGDLAWMDAEGFFYLVGRKSEMIKSGAHRIAPKEIEEMLLEHEAVLEAAVIGVPDDILGEAIKAYVVLKPGCAAVSKDLQIHCRRNLPAFKVPHAVEFVADLPKTPSGKIRKGELK